MQVCFPAIYTRYINSVFKIAIRSHKLGGFFSALGLEVEARIRVCVTVTENRQKFCVADYKIASLRNSSLKESYLVCIVVLLVFTALKAWLVMKTFFYTYTSVNMQESLKM